MRRERSSNILEEYDEKIELYDDFTDSLFSMLEDLLYVEEISFHSIQARLKDRKKLSEKSGKGEERYTCLEDITDIAGLRIITYFADDVDKIAKIIENEFQIDQENSVDRRIIMESNEFGYLSLHYVVSLSEERLNLTENRRFKNCKGEIQIRSILQHAWAEIEHDLGYKTELEIPQKIRRRFTRIAGLLEVADSEFDAIRNRLSEYKDEVTKRIIEEPTEVLINKLSLTSFLKETFLVKDICQQISERTGLSHFEEYEWGLGVILKELNFLGIKTISELESVLKKNRDVVTDWAVLWLTPEPDEPEDMPKYFGSDVPIFYLNYVLVSQSNSIQRILEFLNLSNKGQPDPNNFAQTLISAHQFLVNEEKIKRA